MPAADTDALALAARGFDESPVGTAGRSGPDVGDQRRARFAFDSPYQEAQRPPYPQISIPGAERLGSVSVLGDVSLDEIAARWARRAPPRE